MEDVISMELFMEEDMVSLLEFLLGVVTDSFFRSAEPERGRRREDWCS